MASSSQGSHRQKSLHTSELQPTEKQSITRNQQEIYTEQRFHQDAKQANTGLQGTSKYSEPEFQQAKTGFGQDKKCSDLGILEGGKQTKKGFQNSNNVFDTDQGLKHYGKQTKTGYQQGYQQDGKQTKTGFPHPKFQNAYTKQTESGCNQRGMLTVEELQNVAKQPTTGFQNTDTYSGKQSEAGCQYTALYSESEYPHGGKLIKSTVPHEEKYNKPGSPQFWGPTKAGFQYNNTNSESELQHNIIQTKAEFQRDEIYTEQGFRNSGMLTETRFDRPVLYATQGCKNAAMGSNAEYLFTETVFQGGVKFKAYKNNSEVSFMMALDHLTVPEPEPVLVKEPSFVKEFLKVLKKVKYEAYFFETPPMTLIEAYPSPFEFVLIDASRHLAHVKPFPDPFNDYIKQTETGVAAFQSLGGDAILVAPAIPDQKFKFKFKHYAHLASYVRNESEAKVEEFWQKVGKEMKERLFDQKAKPVWMSTNGTGVHWVHVRLDSSPKYYSHNPYKSPKNYST